MLAVLVILGMLVIATPGELGEFSRNSNGVAAYKFVTVKPCKTGLHRSGYAFAPVGNIALKQENKDGTVNTPACVD